MKAAFFLLIAVATTHADAPASDAQSVRRDEMLRLQLAKPYPHDGCWHYENFALAAYWLNQRTAEADRAILAEREKEFPDSLKNNDFHWHAYLLERIYFLFSRSSKHFPGRMSPEAEAALLDMLWQWAGPRCRLDMAAPERDTWGWGSENHHAQAWSSFWGAAQIFSNYPDYKNRRYADGATPDQMRAAFDGYFKRFANMRAAKGLLWEINSGYNKYTLGGWYNMADFAEDPALKRQMSMLLDLFWADWAIEQIDGVRGGSRHRSYPGVDSTTASNMQGIAWFHFGLGPAKSQHPSAMCAATTFWRPPEVVSDLALDVAERGDYEYTSRRLGLDTPRKDGEPLPNYVGDPAHPFFSPQGVHRLNPDGGGLLRYSWCTPDFVIGTSMVESRPCSDWIAGSSQNRWEGVIFGGHPTARIFAQCLQPKRGSFYNADWSVQKHGSLIVQRLKTAKAKGQRIWFDASLRRVERDGWVFAEAPRAFAAVRVVDGKAEWEADSVEQHRGGKGRTDAGVWLQCANEFSPVILEVVKKTDCKDFDDFQRQTLGNKLQWEKNRLDYSSRLNGANLTLFADYSRPPQIDGRPVNYAPKRVYDSPFLQSDFGSGIITICKGTKKLVLDFNR